MSKHGSGWILTYTGRRFNPLDPDHEMINLVDISHALSQICRFTGHSSHFYSVAQHSILAAKLVPCVATRDDVSRYGLQALQQIALLHDATEAYLSDIASPVKQQPAFEAYRQVEAKLMFNILVRFNLPLTIPESVQIVDKKLCITEAQALMGTLGEGWEHLGTPFTRQELCTFVGTAKCFGFEDPYSQAVGMRAVAKQLNIEGSQ